jgi:hypothetical protein
VKAFSLITYPHKNLTTGYKNVPKCQSQILSPQIILQRLNLLRHFSVAERAAVGDRLRVVGGSKKSERLPKSGLFQDGVGGVSRFYSAVDSERPVA